MERGKIKKLKLVDERIMLETRDKINEIIDYLNEDNPVASLDNLFTKDEINNLKELVKQEAKEYPIEPYYTYELLNKLDKLNKLQNARTTDKEQPKPKTILYCISDFFRYLKDNKEFKATVKVPNSQTIHIIKEDGLTLTIYQE